MKQSDRTPPSRVADRRAERARLLFLAQVPPPVHGGTVVSKRVRDILVGSGCWQVEMLWRGGARTMVDLGRRDLGKYVALLRMLLVLSWHAACGRRFDAAYLAFTPWSHAALRDGLVAWLAGFAAGRVLVHLHSEGLETVLQDTSTRGRLLRALLGGSELVAITDEAAHTGERSGVFSRVNRLPNMADDPGDAVLSNRDLEPAGRPLHCAYLGNFDRRKGLFEFLGVIERLRDRGIPVRASIVGGATRDVSGAAVAAAISEKSLEEHVTLLGFVDEATKSTVLADADLFIYPTRHDHAPLVLLEAMAHGAVPIALDAGGVRSMIGPDLAANVFSHRLPANETIAALTERACLYALDRELLRCDRIAARDRFLEQFSPAAFRTRTLAHFARPPVPVSTPTRGAPGVETADTAPT